MNTLEAVLAKLQFEATLTIAGDLDAGPLQFAINWEDP